MKFSKILHPFKLKAKLSQLNIDSLDAIKVKKKIVFVDFPIKFSEYFQVSHFFDNFNLFIMIFSINL